MEKTIFILASLVVCFLLAVLPNSAADNDGVIVDKCSPEERKDKDMDCAHKFLEKIRNPSTNCPDEFKKFLYCFKNFTLGKCYGDYLKGHENMREPMGRMADMKAGIHKFGRLFCGDDDPMNRTGLPKNITDMLHCKPEFHEKAKDCAKTFHDKFKANKNSTDLCKLFMEAKMCNGELMKKYCKFDKQPPRDPFNPFCPDNKDPKPHAGAGKAYTSVTLTFIALALYLLL